MREEIDWEEVRRRIRSIPIAVPPKHVKRPNRSPESLERRRDRARVRWVEYYHENIEHCRARQKAWEAANPDKVKTKRKKYYDKHKDDPEWLERKRARQREYKRRKKLKNILAIMPDETETQRRTA